MRSIDVPAPLAEELLAYLDHSSERLAFLMTYPAAEAEPATVTAANAWVARKVLYLVDGDDYARQSHDGMELADHVRARLLQTATQEGAALVEIHSHGSTPWPAGFSQTDLDGLAEVAPQMLWRLRQRPYGAIVLHDDQLDALTWSADDGQPTVPDTITLGSRRFRPTGRSLGVLA